MDLERIVRVSELITLGRIPTAEDIRETVGAGAQSAFWAGFAAFYMLEQRNELPVPRHLFDVAMRHEAREVLSPTANQIKVLLVHDNLEDIPKIAKHLRYDISGIRPAVMAYAMLNLLSSLLGPEIADGPFKTGDGRKCGGVYSLTNFLDMVAEPVIHSPTLIAENSNPKFVQELHGNELVAGLTDFGRNLFVSKMEEHYGNFTVSSDEVKRAYDFIKMAYQTFVNYHIEHPKPLPVWSGLKIADLSPAEKREIASIVQGFVLRIEQKLKGGRILEPQYIESRVEEHWRHAVSIIQDENYIIPANLALLPMSKSPYEATLEKTFYRHYIGGMANDSMGFIRSMLAGLAVQDYEAALLPMMGKVLDTTDNVSVIGPKLSNITSINRKARLLLREFTSALIEMRKMGAPADHMKNFYNALSYLTEILNERIETHRDFYFTMSRNETAFNQFTSILTKMSESASMLKAWFYERTGQAGFNATRKY